MWIPTSEALLTVDNSHLVYTPNFALQQPRFTIIAPPGENKRANFHNTPNRALARITLAATSSTTVPEHRS